MLPAESTATWLGYSSDGLVLLKALSCAPVGDSTTMYWLLVSLMIMFCDTGAMATEYGLDSGGLVLVPNTLSSTPPLVNFRMRWLPPSATYTVVDGVQRHALRGVQPRVGGLVGLQQGAGRGQLG